MLPFSFFLTASQHSIGKHDYRTISHKGNRRMSPQNKKTTYEYKGFNLISLMALKCFRLARFSQIIHLPMHGLGGFLGHPEKRMFPESFRRFLAAGMITPISCYGKKRSPVFTPTAKQLPIF
jgi:hypothetical protein